MLALDGISVSVTSLLIQYTKHFKWLYRTTIIIGVTVYTCHSIYPAKSASSIAPANLNSELTQVARIIGELPLMQKINTLQDEFSAGRYADESNKSISKRQKLIYLRQKSIQCMETANLEVNSIRGKIETEMAMIHEQQATMQEKRARAMRRNTMINFVSGGLTKMVGYSIALGNINTPTNVLEIVDGGIQSALSVVTMKELHDESNVVKEMPAVLAQLYEPQTSYDVYPPHIWTYLNEQAPGSPNKTRREVLINQWQERGIFDRKERAARLKEGNVKHQFTLARITPQLLDDRMAMLSELRSVVSQMHTSLMQISQICRKSYEEDPSFEEQP